MLFMLLFAEVWGLASRAGKKGALWCNRQPLWPRHQPGGGEARLSGEFAEEARATCRALWQIRQRRGGGAARLFGGLARRQGEVLPGSLAEQAVE